MKTAFRYTVQSGDTLSKIADGINAATGVTYQDIEAANPGVTPTNLQVGQVLDIPVQGSQPAPSPTPVPVPEAENVGIWFRTWGDKPTPPTGCNIGLAFSGWTDVNNALSSSRSVYDSLPDAKYITFGGGNENGAFTAEGLQEINAAITGGKLSDYKGIAYDVEEGSSGLQDNFAESFKLAKEKGFKVIVTISHSAPYGVEDAKALMESFFANENIDMLSPQLYTSGNEDANDYTTTYGVTWDLYADAKAKIVPSIVTSSYYADAVEYFSKQGISLSGFIQWQ